MCARSASADRPGPTPAVRYPLVILGGGLAGVAAAREAARRGVRVALVLPAQAPAEAPLPTPLGEQARSLQAQTGEARPPEPSDEPQVDVYRGAAVFCRSNAVAVGGRVIRFRKALLATGTRPAPPAIDGAEQCDCLRIDTLGQLAELPGRLAVIGNGPSACNCAQAFCRTGSQVHLIDRQPAILPEEEPDAAALLKARLEQEGVRLHLGCHELAIETTGHLQAVIVGRGGRREKLLVDRVVLCGPRLPNTAGLGLDSAGVAYGDQGVVVGDRLQTSNRRVFAAGGVCGVRLASPQAAQATARLAVHNALSLFSRRLSRLVIPHCVGTDPAIARVGLTRREAAAGQIDIETYQADLPQADQAVPEHRSPGLIAVHVRRRTGSIVGATVVAHAADELIAPLVLLMTRRLPLTALADVVACHSSRFESLVGLAERCRQARGVRLPAWLSRRRT